MSLDVIYDTRRIKKRKKEVLLLGSTIITNACVFYFLANNKPSSIVRRPDSFAPSISRGIYRLI